MGILPMFTLYAHQAQLYAIECVSNFPWESSPLCGIIISSIILLTLLLYTIVVKSKYLYCVYMWKVSLSIRFHGLLICHLFQINTFQGILITNGTQSYSVFTYECDRMEWSDGATIGYNAGVEYHETHPLSGTITANAVDCLHSDINITVNNIIHNLAFSTHYVTSPAPTGT